MFDRSSQIIRLVITAFVLLIVSSLIVVVFMNLKNKEDKQDEIKYVGTTSRRTYKTTSSTSKKTTTQIIYEESTTTMPTTLPTTSEPLTTTVPTTITTTSSSKKTTTTTKKKTTTKKTTTKKKTTTTTTTTEVVPDREIAYTSTTYPGAIDFWEWGIVDLINEERASLGLPTLDVAVDLRELAETAADYWYDHSNDIIDDIIGNHSYYGKKLINANYLESYQYLYDATVSNTDVTTNPHYRYLGVGVIYRDVGDTGMRTHYYIIIYE